MSIRRHCMRFAAVAVGMIAAGSVVAARWEITGAAPEVLIESNTAGPSLRYPGTTGVWVTYSPSLSVDCGPPRGCYAKTQRVYYVFNCSPRYAMPMERISADLGGSVIKRETRGDGDAYSADADVGALLILQTYCPARESRDRR